MGYLTYLGSHTFMSCSQTIYFLLKVRRARVIKKNRGGFIDRQRKGVARALADVSQKNENKNKATSVYRLVPEIIRYLLWDNLAYETSSAARFPSSSLLV